jgi:hypothetical protein
MPKELEGHGTPDPNRFCCDIRVQPNRWCDFPTNKGEGRVNKTLHLQQKIDGPTDRAVDG